MYEEFVIGVTFEGVDSEIIEWVKHDSILKCLKHVIMSMTLNRVYEGSIEGGVRGTPLVK